MENMISIPWKLEPPRQYRESYAEARREGNAERLLAVAAIIGLLFTVLAIQHILGPGVPRESLAFRGYLAIYICFIAGSAAYLLYCGFLARGRASGPAQWLLVLLILSGTTSLAVFDSDATGDLSALLLGLLSVAVLFRCRLPLFAAAAGAVVLAFWAGCFLLSGRVPSPGASVPLVLDILTALVLSLALGHYDIRAFILQKELEQGISERNLLFQELQHRVKNSMTMVSSLLSLDEQRLDEGPSKEILRLARGRIQTISSLYERLYRSGELDAVDFALYARDIVDGLVEANLAGQSRVSVGTSLAPLRIDLKRAIPLGLLLNEFLTNAIKHAFPGDRRGRIEVSLEEAGGRVLLQVADDGVGLGPGFSVQGSTGLGMMLASHLARQLDAELRTLEGEGASFELGFSL
jgi:two-component sensor histidine kinase